VNLPLLAVDVKSSDFAWTPTETEPEKLHSVQSSTLFMPELFHADVMEWSKKYAESLMSNPEWQRKQAEKTARKRAREARLAERQRTVKAA